MFLEVIIVLGWRVFSVLREGKWSPGSPITLSTLLNRAPSGWRGAMYKAEYQEIDYNVTTFAYLQTTRQLHISARLRMV